MFALTLSVIAIVIIARIQLLVPYQLLAGTPYAMQVKDIKRRIATRPIISYLLVQAVFISQASVGIVPREHLNFFDNAQVYGIALFGLAAFIDYLVLEAKFSRKTYYVAGVVRVLAVLSISMGWGIVLY